MIRSADIDRAAAFYAELGLGLEKHRHGSGPEHYAAAAGASDPVFEIYPLKEGESRSDTARVGFSVDDVDGIVRGLSAKGYVIVAQPKDSPWGRRAVAQDPDGHSVELITPPDRDVFDGRVSKSHESGMNPGSRDRR